jgi:hypothetical protein
MSIFFSNRDYRGACQYGSTTFTLPSSKSRKNVFGNYLGNTSNPVSLHVSRWQVSKVVIFIPAIASGIRHIFLLYYVLYITVCQLIYNKADSHNIFQRLLSTHNPHKQDLKVIL